MTSVHGSGLFIPVEKQSLFMLVFEEPLLHTYRIVSTFGPTRKNNSCEVKFKYIGANHSILPYDFNMAKRFLKQNQCILYGNEKIKKKMIRSPEVTEVIDLDDEIPSLKAREIRTVDLTEVEPEVIVLDDTFNHLNKTLSHINTSFNNIDELEIIDLSSTGTSSCYGNKPARFGNDVEVLCFGVNNKQHKSITPSHSPNMKVTPPVRKVNNTHANIDKRSKVSVSLNSAGVRTFISRREKQVKPTTSLPLSTPSISQTNSKHKLENKKSRDLSISLNSAGVRSVVTSKGKQKKALKRSVPLSCASETPNRKRRKLQDASNIPSSSSPASKPLTENVLKYYTQINNRIQRLKKLKGKSPKNRKKSVQTPKEKWIIKQDLIRKRKALQTQNFNNRPKIMFKPKLKQVAETNTFNPNPLDVDREGLRPVIVDGCNIAIGHGKGTFSVKGIKICVDYFARKGHKHIKVFLPLSRQQYFSDELLAELNTKSDIVFTPSQQVNGVWKTSYDDRFIVQYAVEFGGVIVSTDNYRDLLKENPKWRDTIHKRLLMFTWVDDFLMFPMDPLGKTGPTLERFLRF